MQSDKSELYSKEIDMHFCCHHLDENPVTETVVIYKDGTKKSFRLTEEEEKELFFKTNPELASVKKNKISPKDEFFSKEIEEIDLGECEERYPCSHPEITVSYIDGSIKYFDLDGYDILDLCKRFNRELPDHFSEMRKFE